MRRKLLGEEHPDVIVSLANLASALQDLREYAEAEQLYRQVLTLRRKLFGEEHPKDTKLTQIRTTHSAPETLVEDCGHPKHASLHLKVSAQSACDGFKSANN